MTSKTLARLFFVAAVCCLLNGCRSEFHLVLFNDTDDTIIIRRRELDRTPMVVVAGISGEITGVSTDDFSIERNGKVAHYHFPSGYTYPSAAVPSGYARSVPHIGRSFYFQLLADNRIYILKRGEALESTDHSGQPGGFPLIPH